MKTNIKIGDIVIVPKELSGLTHDKKESMLAEVVGIYRNFFNVRYENSTWEQSIKWCDVNKLRNLSALLVETA